MGRVGDSMARIGAVLIVLAAAGCGGGGAADAPKLPHALGVSLAAQASAVEASLASGDTCGAAGHAAKLQGMVAGAIASGRVPATLRAPLSSSVASLAAEITCLPPAPKGPPDKKHGHGPDEKHGPGKGHGDGRDGDGGGD